MARTFAPADLLTYDTDADLFLKLSNCLSHSPLSLIVTHVSRSGMSRTIKVLGSWGGIIHDVSREVARLTGHRWSERGVHVSGCGMDMGFHLMTILGNAWAKHAEPDAPYCLAGRFANNGMRWDGDAWGDKPVPWPSNPDKRNWRWV